MLYGIGQMLRPNNVDIAARDEDFKNYAFFYSKGTERTQRNGGNKKGIIKSLNKIDSFKNNLIYFFI